jgi:hypothetical protein
VSVNYHTRSDFRRAHGEALDVLLSDSVAALLSVGAVTRRRSLSSIPGGPSPTSVEPVEPVEP